jgi:hypothetical protein
MNPFLPPGRYTGWKTPGNLIYQWEEKECQLPESSTSASLHLPQTCL